MKKAKFTHEAIEVGVEGRIDITHRKIVLLRETKTMFVGNNDRRYSKINGYMPGRRTNFRLDMTSIRKVEV